MRWNKAYFCKCCDREMSYGSKMDSNGTCPMCGVITGRTICETNDRSYYYQCINKSWKFWKIRRIRIWR